MTACTGEPATSLAPVVAVTTLWRAVGPLRPGDPRHIAGFEVLGRLGEGGMGVVFLAAHPDEGRAALKFVRAGGDDTTFRARFGREIEAARRVESPRVAQVLAADPDAPVPWLATAFVDGPTLQEAIDESGPMAGDRLVALATALADALVAVHRADVVHRDLKPSNILLTPETPVVIDFGIATLREAPALTRTGMALGTPGWMAPEQVQGQRCGPPTDVFTWAMVVAFAAAGRPPFGRGPADALFYRIVHERPDLPALPAPLDVLVPAALSKEPDRRPDVMQLVAALTGEPLEPTTPGMTALGRTVADRTAVVPTVVALGWDVEALPTRPDGRARDVPEGVIVGRPRPLVSPGEPAAGAGARATPAFWYAGEDHHDARTLAAAFQTFWDDAIDQVFRTRNPIWIDELRGFLRSLGRDDAEQRVAAGAGDAPPAAAMARLLLALDENLDPRVGSVWLTPEGLTAAAQVVTGGRSILAGVGAAVAESLRGQRDGDAGSVGGGDGAGAVHGPAGGARPLAPGDDVRIAERLAEIGSARVLRLWRSLPGMERAAAIDERWHAGTEAFGRFVTKVSPHAGWPTPQESQRASATLLLCAVHPEHERQLERRLTAARRTGARQQAWWAQLAAEGQRNPPAAVLAVMTADRARSVTDDERAAARAVDRERRDAQRAADAQRREAERAQVRDRRAAVVATQPRFVPVRKALSSAARGWTLALLLAGLVVFLWADRTFTDALVDHYLLTSGNGVGGADSVRTARDASDATGWAGVLLVLLPAMHVATRIVLQQGTRRVWVRAYAGAAAAVDLLLGLVYVPASLLAILVLGVGADTTVASSTPAPFGDESWGAVAVLLPYGLVGLYLVVRSAWRLTRVVLGRPLAGPFFGPGVVVG